MHKVAHLSGEPKCTKETDVPAVKCRCELVQKLCHKCKTSIAADVSMARELIDTLCDTEQSKQQEASA